MSAYVSEEVVSIRQRASAYVSIQQRGGQAGVEAYLEERRGIAATVIQVKDIRQRVHAMHVDMDIEAPAAARPQRIRAVLPRLLRQFLYFCTGKTSHLSTWHIKCAMCSAR